MINYLLLKKRHSLFLLISLIVAILSSTGCGAQAAPKVYRVGVLSGLDTIASIGDSFKAEMTKLGYVEGQNIVYDVQKTNFDPPREEQILRKFVADQVDLIFVFPTEASLAAKKATVGTNIPVLFANAFVEGNNLIESVREPGGNITGVRYPGPDLAVKRFEILHELVPQAKQIFVPYQKGYPSVLPQLELLRPAAATAGVTLIEAPVDNVTELEAELQAQAKSADIGAILTIAEPLAGKSDVFALLGKFATEHKTPIGGILRETENYKSIFSVAPDSLVIGKQAAPLADKIFKGIPAGTIPVVSAEAYLRINYKAAQEQGLNVSEGLLSQADEIIR